MVAVTLTFHTKVRERDCNESCAVEGVKLLVRVYCFRWVSILINPWNELKGRYVNSFSWVSILVNLYKEINVCWVKLIVSVGCLFW